MKYGKQVRCAAKRPYSAFIEAPSARTIFAKLAFGIVRNYARDKG
jgi:hypothetical protein